MSYIFIFRLYLQCISFYIQILFKFRLSVGFLKKKKEQPQIVAAKCLLSNKSMSRRKIHNVTK